VANYVLFDPGQVTRLPWRHRVAYLLSLTLLTPVAVAIGGFNIRQHALPIILLSIGAGLAGVTTTELKFSHDRPFLWRTLEHRSTRWASRTLLIATIAGLTIMLGSPLPLALVPLGVVLLTRSRPL
jgi:hypothetical protein